jgi:hypothetical protein
VSGERGVGPRRDGGGSGSRMIGVGLIIIAITLVVFGVSSGTEDAGSAGRGATLMVVIVEDRLIG